MKIALLISGYLRNYKENVDFIKNNVINKYEEVDIYLHITKDENQQDRYLNNINKNDVEFIVNELNPHTLIIENNSVFSNDNILNNLYNHWSKLYKLNSLKKINENINNSKYDIVVRYRPDLVVEDKNIFDYITYNSIIIPKESKVDVSKLNNPTDNHISDALAFGPSELMDKYFDVFEKLPFYVKKFGKASETILFEYLNDEKINYTLENINYFFILSKCNVFAICGDSGSGKSTLSDLLKLSFNDSFKLECDRYHKWERNDSNWNKFTHLNPNANFITKMKKDIFNLKIGNDVYQVDYDHSSGKFTENQLINSSNNLIVCGLHSLYDNSQHLYDLKIYMDTEEDLKKKWKIKRDVLERGYSIEKVMKSIDSRKKDFIKYIAPQKESADIIVKFFSKNNIDFDDLSIEDEICLELSIKSHFNIKHIINNLEFSDVPFSFEKSGDRNKIQFNKYKKVDLIKNNTYSFYDYILFFILNIK